MGIRWRTLSTVFVVLICCGCGKKGPDLGQPVTVTGTVTVAGQPAEGVAISLSYNGEGRPAEMRFFQGVTDAQGGYRIEGVFEGQYSVSFAEHSAQAVDDPALAPAEETGVLKGVDLSTRRSIDVSASVTSFDFDL